MTPGRSRLLPVLLCLALVGIAVSVGLVVLAALGWPTAVGYAVVVVALLLVGGARARRALAPPPAPAGRTCTCCTTTQHDPVRIV